MSEARLGVKSYSKKEVVLPILLSCRGSFDQPSGTRLDFIFHHSTRFHYSQLLRLRRKSTHCRAKAIPSKLSNCRPRKNFMSQSSPQMQIERPHSTICPTMKFDWRNPSSLWTQIECPHFHSFDFTLKGPEVPPGTGRKMNSPF